MKAETKRAIFTILLWVTAAPFVIIWAVVGLISLMIDTIRYEFDRDDLAYIAEDVADTIKSLYIAYRDYIHTGKLEFTFKD